ncbi:hypothetical protein HZ326_31322 [Fusarium oxysporum f. sp. albedinis]|nr:hypothetical protein HZ326_31322 [Fusarium oxysporum f. sp. albedinis]
MGTRTILSRVPFSLAKTPTRSSWCLTSTACAALLSRTWIIGAQRGPLGSFAILSRLSVRRRSRVNSSSESPGSRSSISELERYLRLEPQDTQDAIQWYRDHRASFPSLNSFVLDAYAIPAMASACERQFSLGKLTLTSQRLSMGADTLERVQCLRNWVRHGGVKLGSWVGN